MKEKIIMSENLKFYDAFGDKLELKEDDNPDIVDLVITEDTDDEGNFNKASCLLSKEQALKLANFLIEKFSKINS